MMAELGKRVERAGKQRPFKYHQLHAIQALSDEDFEEIKRAHNAELN